MSRAAMAPSSTSVRSGARARQAQRQLPRHQRQSAQAEPEVAAGSRRQGRSRAGGAAWCDPDGHLGKGRHGHRVSATKHRDGRGRHGRCCARQSRLRRGRNRPLTGCFQMLAIPNNICNNIQRAVRSNPCSSTTPRILSKSTSKDVSG